MCSRNSESLPPYIRKYLNRLVQEVKPEAIILFGSVVQGKTHKTSDYDFFVISKTLPKDFWERTKLLWKNKPLDVDVFGFQPEEVRRNIGRGFILDVLLTGVTVYGSIAELKMLAQRFVREKKLVRTAAGYFRKDLISQSND